MNNNIRKNYRESLKSRLWAKYYYDERNKKTYLNGTQSAIEAYGYDSKKQYNLASVTGSKNLIKYKVLAVMELDMMGLGFGALMKIGMKKAIEGSYKDLDKFAVRLGYFDPL